VTTTSRQTEATQRIVETLAECGIRLVASLPDDWVSDLIDTLDRDERFIHVPVNREESAVGLCSGAFFGGLPSLALMGASGLMTIIYAITKINYTYHIPLFIFTTMRGRIGDPRSRHMANGLYLEPVMDAISLPYLVVDRREEIAHIPDAFRHSRVMNHPTVVGFTEPVLRGEV
jgi:sulfopyruvate decarboxylase TPP-binding subunit